MEFADAMTHEHCGNIAGVILRGLMKADMKRREHKEA